MNIGILGIEFELRNNIEWFMQFVFIFTRIEMILVYFGFYARVLSYLKVVLNVVLIVIEVNLNLSTNLNMFVLS